MDTLNSDNIMQTAGETLEDEGLFMEEDEDEAGALAVYVVTFLSCAHTSFFSILAVVISQTC